MSSVDWEEVKRLAADFQRAQLSSGAQRLSERNCIEIITRLIEEKLLDVVFTTDGKEYITPTHLIKEIKDELFVSGGRINLVDLAKSLLVDLQVVTRRAVDIEKSDSTVRIINGQLISNAYITTLCNEINEKLQQQGQINVADLTTQYDLPSDFLLATIEKQLGKIIQGTQDKQDRNIIFTPSFVEKNLAIVRGALIAITRPVATSTLIGLIGVPERIFFSAVDSMAERKEMPGVFTGKQKSSGQYVPYIYTKAQQEWVTNFYHDNGYIEYEAMSRQGISDPSGFVQKSFGKMNILLLPSVAVGPAILDQVEGAIDEAVSSSSFVKLAQIVPSVFEDSDLEAILKKVLQNKNSLNLHIFNSTVVVTDPYLKNLLKKFEPIIEQLSKKFVNSGEYLKNLIDKNNSNKGDDEKTENKVDKKEERRKKASEGKGGGGTQGRETKTKSTKKKYLKNKQHDSDEENEVEKKRDNKIEIVSKADILVGLKGEELLLEEDEDNLLQDLANYLHPLFNKRAIEVARTLFESTIASSNESRRKKHTELQEKIYDLLLNIRLFEKGIKQFDKEDVSLQLTKYLLKSICTDVAIEILDFVSQQNKKESNMEQRLRAAIDAAPDLKDILTRLQKSLSGNSIEEFLTAAEIALGPSGADILVYKHDKKKERPSMLHQREMLIEQLNIANDPALVLHLVTLILFQAATQNLIHASGKFVSNLITFLKDRISLEDFQSLRSYHDMVLQYLTNEENKNNVGSLLQEEMPRIKNIAFNAKKTFGKNKERTISNSSS